MSEADGHVWLPPVVPTIVETGTRDVAAEAATFGPTWWSPLIAAKPVPPRLRGVPVPDFSPLPFLTKE